MSGNSFLVILVLVAAAVGALFLFSTPSSSPVTEVAQATAGTSVASSAGISRPSLWADAGADQTAGERETVRLAGSGGAAGGDLVTYQWRANGGLGFFADSTRPDATYTAPSACDCCQQVTLTLTVTHRSGATANDSMILRVRDPIACPERTCRGPSFAIVPVCPPAVIESRCPEPDVPCAGPCVSEAPVAPTCAQVPVPCRCAEGCAAVWDSAWPQVAPALSASERPTPRIVRQFPSHVTEGSATPLRALVTNPSCTSVCFSWSASQGWLERSDTLEPIYHAPLTLLPEGERVTITFTIQDATGRPSYDQIRLNVENVPPS
jgi:hypothetical protein